MVAVCFLSFDDEDGYSEQLVRFAHDLERGIRDNTSDPEAGRTWSKLSPEELELEQQSSISVLNSQFQKPKQQDKDTPNGCFHSLREGECTRKDIAATHAR